QSSGRRSGPVAVWSVFALPYQFSYSCVWFGVAVRSTNLVEEFLSGLADALHVGDVPYRQIGMGDVPAFGRDLVLDDPVFHLWAANPRPAFASGEDDIHLVGDLRCEVIDIRVKIAVVGSREEQPRVVVQEHETHVVDGANPVRVIEATIPQLQQRAQPRGPA